MPATLSLALRCALMFWTCVHLGSLFGAEPIRQAIPLSQQLESESASYLAEQATLRGDASRGAVVFFKSAANCVGCHASGDEPSPLGPNLASLGSEITGEYVVDALLRPSKHIRAGYETYSVVTTDGQTHVGLMVRQDAESITLRRSQSLDEEFELSRAEIDLIQKNPQSMMPEGLTGSMKSQGEFLDLVAYVREVAHGGDAAAKRLRPSPAALAVKDDSANLDHRGIISGMKRRDFEAGEKLFHGDCSNCHGVDGSTPSLATSRAFGTQKLKYGSDPYRMFMTLTKGNGLMAPMSYLTPHQRYQVVHYIREAFMKDRNPDYFKVDKKYLAALPEGTENGMRVEVVDRDFGPALVSQLRTDIPSVLSIPFGEMTVAFNLHTMDLADVWTGGFLDLSETQHIRPRGEGTANPVGESIPPIAAWKWGHDGSLDYSREGLLPRGPLPEKWMDYHGYFLFNDDVVLSYGIDQRELLHRVESIGSTTLVHQLEIGPGRPLTFVACGNPEGADFEINDELAFASSDAKGAGHFVATELFGDMEGVQLRQATEGRLRVVIPADDKPRKLSVAVGVGNEASSLREWRSQTRSRMQASVASDLGDAKLGGVTRWPQPIHTVGYLGLEKSGYAIDTISLPTSTPWNTWFRTSAIDFFADGRMALATHGGDVWIVSGIDDDLLDLTWKRFASGLYEPFGLKVVGDQVVLTCKDRLVRLHDFNGDDEADFYESLSADTDVSTNFHAFNFDLQTDDAGNFYYAKSGHGANFALPGAVWKISPDGKTREVVCTGFRSPNGLGSLPGGLITVSDNQGQWIPASKISLVKQDAFYGWVPTYASPPRWAPDGGAIDIRQVVAPESFEKPLVWMPQEFDNSSGGQLWVDDPRFGPLAGHLLHTSFGKGWMSYLMIQDIDGISQAAIVKLPYDFSTGIMRGSVNPSDGQVYVTGLQGWNGGGRAGLADGGVQRVRFTGVAPRMITGARIVFDGLELDFNFKLDSDSAAEISSYVAEQWNYHWTGNYGSDQYAPSSDKPGTEPLEFTSVHLVEHASDVGTRVRLRAPGLRPVDQLRLVVHVRDDGGEWFDEEIYWTIHAVPPEENPN